jgi:hypothetical protein
MASQLRGLGSLNTGRRIKVRVELAGARTGTKRLERPFIRVFIVAQNVRIAVIGLKAEIRSVRTVPLFVDQLDEVHFFT